MILRKSVITINTIPIEVKKRCVELTKEGYTSREVYDKYYSKQFNTAYESFRSMLKRWKKKTFADGELLEVANLGYGYIPHDSTVQVSGDGKIVQAWIKQKANDGMMDKVLEIIKSMTPHEPIERRPETPTNRMLEIPFDDMHMGIAFFEDYKETLLNTMDVIEERCSKEINITIGPDLLHTNDMRGHTNKGTYIGEIDIERAYADTVSFYSLLIQSALHNAERVRVIYLKGNHSECLSWTIVQVLKVKYPQCEYEDSIDQERKIITYGKVFIGLTHGEELRGTLKDIKELFAEENPMEYYNATVKEIHTSHLHTEKDTGDINGCVVRRLSTRVPTDKYHKKHGYTCNNKRFMLFEYTTDRLKSIRYV